MNTKTGFVLDISTMLLIVFMCFLSGFFMMSNLEDNWVFSLLFLFSAGIVILKHRSKIPKSK